MAPHICIIGAGISGLRCAGILLQKGYRVTIFEARDRIGGRVSEMLPYILVWYYRHEELIIAPSNITQSEELGRTIDVGANWVHSTGANPIVELAKQTDTPLHLWEHTTCLIDGSGTLVEKQKAADTLERVCDTLEKASEHSAQNSKTIDPSTSLYDFFVEHGDRLLRTGEIDEYEHALLLGMAEMWGAYVGDRAERQSLKFFFLEDCIEGDDLFIVTNYQKIVAKIAEVPLAQATVQFGKRVVCIQRRGRNSDGVVVQLLDGQEQEFDEVVVTTPLGWLKRNKHFLGPLTPRSRRPLTPFLLVGSRSEALPNGTLLHGKAPISTVTTCTPTSFMHWVSPSYAGDTNPDRWRLETVSYAAFPPPLRHPTLLFYTFGNCSTHVMSLIYGLTGQARYDALDAFFSPYYSRLSNYNPKTCKPEAYLATEWCKDELSGYGSYSNFQIGMTDAASDVECMRHGMPEHHIWLAGEHTAPFDGLGTVSGAFFSGEAVAKRIAQVYEDGGQSRPCFSAQ
ncbi:hypothetical protein MMC13_003731 [Lambiella insularis]|nr:hypothetical protein [Lambiella insularis]